MKRRETVDHSSNTRARHGAKRSTTDGISSAPTTSVLPSSSITSPLSRATRRRSGSNCIGFVIGSPPSSTRAGDQGRGQVLVTPALGHLLRGRIGPLISLARSARHQVPQLVRAPTPPPVSASGLVRRCTASRPLPAGSPPARPPFTRTGATTPQGAMPLTARILPVTSPPGVPPRSCHTRPGPGGETTRRFSTVRPHAPSAPHHRR